jgi:8-hydroxy-5-deazaflavin:NADPH oxidoreductase
MKIGVLGTGIVGRSHAARLTELGHEIKMGTRDVVRTLSLRNSDAMGNPPLKEWLDQNPKVSLGSLSEAAKHGQLVINAVNGQHALEALKMAGGEHLQGKVIMDISNPLDFSKGMPPSLFVVNNDSLGEQVQKAYPKAKVVKTLNTVNAGLQVEPRKLVEGDHSAFLSGNDPEAKKEVVKVLNWYGWKNIIDLGDITTARGAEMVLPIWVQLFGILKTPMFNFKIVTEE